MKLIMAVIDPPKFEGVRKALSEFGIKGLMVSEVMGAWPAGRPHRDLPGRGV